MARVFISYANEDLIRAREVHRWLIEAGHEVFLDQDSRDGIAVGEQWRQRLRERLRWADAVVCVVTFAFSPDGRTLAVSADNGNVNLWDLTDLNQVRDHAVQRACSITHGGLDRAEWDRRIPRLRYQDSCPPDGD